MYWLGARWPAVITRQWGLSSDSRGQQVEAVFPSSSEIRRPTVYPVLCCAAGAGHAGGIVPELDCTPAWG